MRLRQTGLDREGAAIARAGIANAPEGRLEHAEIGVGDRETRVQLHRALEHARGLLHEALHGDRPRQREESGGRERVPGGDLAGGRSGARVDAQGKGGARGRDPRVDVGKTGPQLRRVLEARDRAVEGAVLVKEPAERVQGIHGVGVDRDRPQERVDRRDRVAASPQGLTEVGMTRRVARGERGRALESRDRLVQAAALHGEDAEKKERLRMVGNTREDLAVKPLRLREFSRAVVLEASPQEVHGSRSR